MGSAKGLEKAKEAAAFGASRDGAKPRAAHRRFDAQMIGAAEDVSKFIVDQ